MWVDEAGTAESVGNTVQKSGPPHWMKALDVKLCGFRPVKPRIFPCWQFLQAWVTQIKSERKI